MTTQPMDLARLSERLERLEQHNEQLAKRNEQLARSNRWLRGAGVAILLGVGVAALSLHGATAAGKADKPSTATVTGLNIVDAAGTRRIVFGTSADGSANITMFRPNGKDIGATLILDKDGNPQLTMMDPTKARRVWLGTDSNGFAFLNLGDNKGVGRSIMSVTQTGVPSVHLADAGGAIRETLGVNADGQPFLAQYDRGKNKRAVFALDKDHAPNIALYDSNKIIRAQMNVAAGFPEAGAIALYDARGALLWAAK